MKKTGCVRGGAFVACCLVLALTGIAAVDGGQGQDRGDPKAQRLKRFGAQLDGYRRQLKIPGMAAGIVKDGRLIWSQGFGWADIKTRYLSPPRRPFTWPL